MTAAGFVPVTLELLDRDIIQAVEAALHLGLDPDAGAMLMIESDAGGELAAERAGDRGRGVPAAGATSLERSHDETEADWLREARRKAHWSLEQAGVARMEDVGVPRTRVAELMDRHRSHLRAHGMQVGVFGHAGDGNFHPTFVPDRDDRARRRRSTPSAPSSSPRFWPWAARISGEHGTGVAKRGYLEAQVGPP